MEDDGDHMTIGIDENSIRYDVGRNGSSVRARAKQHGRDDDAEHCAGTCPSRPTTKYAEHQPAEAVFFAGCSERGEHHADDEERHEISSPPRDGAAFVPSANGDDDQDEGSKHEQRRSDTP